MDIALTLWHLQKNGKAYDYYGSLTGNKKEDYDNITWNDEREKPSWDELIAHQPTMKSDVEDNKILDRSVIKIIESIEKRVYNLEHK